MRKIVLIPFIFLFLQFVTAQYESGYIVTKAGENKIGFIKSQNWNVGFEQIKFKNKLEEDAQDIAVYNLSQFGIGNDIKFVVDKVLIDMSSENINNLSFKKAPVLESKTIALRKLVDGKISLYEYQFANGTRFFYKKPNQNFVQLISKRYLTPARKVGVNDDFKVQLNLLLEDQKDVLKNKLSIVKYSRKSIAKLISEYNLLTSEGSDDYFGQIEKETSFKISLHIGQERSTFTVGVFNGEAVFPDFNRTIYGGEIEFLMLNKKLGLFTGFTAKSNVSETAEYETSISGLFRSTSIAYKNNTVNLGFKGYIETFRNLDLILSTGLSQHIVSEFTSGSEIFNRNATDFFFGAGIGYKKVFAEVRFFGDALFIENLSERTDFTNSNFNFRLSYIVF